MVFKKFFTNKHGKVVIWQTPNTLLWMWIGIKLVSLVLNDGSFKSGLGLVSKAAIFAWAYLELTGGESFFRRVLGGVVLTLTIISFFG